MSTLPVLAHRTDLAQVGEGMRQFLSLRLGEEDYALPIEHIREIIEFGGLTPIPLMPPFLRGVINLRGAVVPVVDLAVRFGRERTEIARRTCVVIVELLQDKGVQVLGIMVDAVNAVLDVRACDVEPTPPFGARLRAEFVAGILRQGEGFVIIPDINQVLALEELSELTGAR